MRAVTCIDKTVSFVLDHADPKPTDDECLIRVHLAGICATDLHILDGYMGFEGVLGHEMVGTVEAGPDAWLGKRVAADINCVCRTCDMCATGLSNHCRKRTVLGIDGRDGCFADFVAVPVQNLHEIPETVTDEEAVFVEPVAAAFQVLTQCPVGPRHRVTVAGSGRLGILVAQALATTGCQLTVVGRNAAKLLLCEKRGIQTRHVDELIPKADQDVVVDCTGDPHGLELAMALVRPRGTIVLKSTCAGSGNVNLAPIVVDEITVMGSRCGPFREAIDALARKAVDVRPLVSRTFPIEDTIAAFAAAQDPKNTKIVLKINPR